MRFWQLNLRLKCLYFYGRRESNAKTILYRLSLYLAHDTSAGRGRPASAAPPAARGRWCSVITPPRPALCIRPTECLQVPILLLIYCLTLHKSLNI